jgi:DNA polymerase-3 subunit epsilon
VGGEAPLIRFGKFADFAKADLDADWRAIDYCALDVETTGLDLREDEIISIAAAQIHKGRIVTENNFYREVRPRKLPSAQSVQVHGLRAMDLANAEPIESLIPELAEQIGDRVLIAHAEWIERAFLKHHLKGTGVNFSRPMIDTAGLARELGYAAEGTGREPSLELLARQLHVPAYAPHNALGDALTTAVVFLAFATQLERARIAEGEPRLTLRNLLDTSAANSVTS